MTWYFQYVLARDIAAARQAEASRSNAARLARAHSDGDGRKPGLRRPVSPRRRTIAATVALLGSQVRRVAGRLDEDSASKLDRRSVTGIQCDGEAEGA